MEEAKTSEEETAGEKDTNSKDKSEVQEEEEFVCWNIMELQKRDKALIQMIPRGPDTVTFGEDSFFSTHEEFYDLFSLKHMFAKTFIFDSAFFNIDDFGKQMPSEDLRPSAVEHISIYRFSNLNSLKDLCRVFKTSRLFKNLKSINFGSVPKPIYDTITKILSPSI
jgi:hypothetical protein